MGKGKNLVTRHITIGGDDYIFVFDEKRKKTHGIKKGTSPSHEIASGSDGNITFRIYGYNSGNFDKRVVVTCDEADTYDPVVGMALAYLKLNINEGWGKFKKHITKHKGASDDNPDISTE